jgi:hypothetical protein
MFCANRDTRATWLPVTFFGLSILLAACGGGGGGARSTYSLSGSVDGDVRRGVAIAVSGAVSASVSADADGHYSVSDLPDGTYAVTPAMAGYTFTEASRTVVIGGADSSGNDFTAAAVLYTVGGTISGAVQEGVTVTVTGTTEGGSPFTTSITTTGGTFSVPNVPNGSYTLEPARLGYSFSPVSASVAISAGNATVPDFAAAADDSVRFNLSGRVTGAIAAGVTITATGSVSGSASTQADGTYTIPNLPNGSYAVSASRPGYTFGGSLASAIDGADSSGNDFTATAVLYSISGTVSGDVRAGVAITISGTTEAGSTFSPVTTTTLGDGGYSVAGVPNGDYTASAGKLGYSFNPISRLASIAGGNSTGRDFTASTGATPAFSAAGGAGTGTTGTGGAGGQFYASSYGSISVRASDTVDAAFGVTITPDFGLYDFTVNADTTVTVSDSDDIEGALCQVYQENGGSGFLYIGDGDGTCGSAYDEDDTEVSGLTIAGGATLVLLDPSGGALRLSNDLVINGTLAGDPSAGISVEANLIEVGSTGKITASGTDSANDGGQIRLGEEDGQTRFIINSGTIESKGYGSGAGGYVHLEPSELVVNTGTIDVSGGENGGSGGEFDAYVDYGDFYSSGTVLMNGGDGEYGGDTEYYSENHNGYSGYVETAYRGNTRGRNGDIVVSGTWEARGGDAQASGNGGGGGYLYFQTDGMGSMRVNATMIVRGGNGAGADSSGGGAGEVDFYSQLDPWGYGGYVDPTPGTIRIAGTYDLRGGTGDQYGGGGGILVASSQASSQGGADIEFVGFPVIVLNGGQGGAVGGAANDYGAFELHTNAYDESSFAKSITNEADLQARGGNSTAGGMGGTGGYVNLQTGTPRDAGTVLVNSGNIDVTGGSGATGSRGGSVDMAAQHVGNAGSVTANGGDGTTAGGAGGDITLMFSEAGTPTTNTGTLSVAGGAPDGSAGTINIDGGGPD